MGVECSTNKTSLIKLKTVSSIYIDDCKIIEYKTQKNGLNV